MGDLESRAMATEPADCRMSLWKRYVDGILEKIKAGYTQELTDHFNTGDNTSNIKFTQNKQTEPLFLDMKIHHEEDSRIKNAENPHTLDHIYYMGPQENKLWSRSVPAVAINKFIFWDLARLVKQHLCSWKKFVFFLGWTQKTWEKITPEQQHL